MEKPDTRALAAQIAQSERFTVDQPQVLAQIGAQHAYALGLEGKGVSIAIEDAVIDFLIEDEFGEPVALSADAGARLAYRVGNGEHWSSPVRQCAYSTPRCTRIEIDAEGGAEAVNRLVHERAHRKGWDKTENVLYIADTQRSENDPAGQVLRWWEMPSPQAENHATLIASIAAGARHGVAAQATLIPAAIDLQEGGDHFIVSAQKWTVREQIEAMDEAAREEVDKTWADDLAVRYTNADIYVRAYSEPWWRPHFI